MSQADDERIKKAKPDFERIERFLAFVRRIDIFADKGDIFALFDCSPAAPYPEIEGKAKTFRDYYQASGAKKFAELKKIVAQETQVILAILSDPVLREGYRFFSIERMLWSDFEVYTKRDKILDAKEEEDLIAEGKFLGLSEDEVSAIIQKWLDDPKIDVRKGERQTAGPSFSGSPKIDLSDLLGMTYFDVLGIPQDASYDQIKAARENKLNEIGLIRDKKKADAKRVLVEFAWECLKDPQRKREYEEKLKYKVEPTDGGQPRLVVERKNNSAYSYTNVRKGSIITEKMVIKNPENGVLQGTIKTDAKWLEANRSHLSDRHEQELVIFVYSSKIPAKTYKADGNVEIDTNGGKDVIPFKVILESYDVELARLKQYYVPLAAALIGFFFSLPLHMLGFVVAAVVSLGLGLFLSRPILDLLLEKGINLSQFPAPLIRGISIALVVLTIVIQMNLSSKQPSTPITPSRPVQAVNEVQSQIRVRSVRFFEGGHDAPERSQRVYTSQFQKQNTRYIFFELSFDRTNQPGVPWNFELTSVWRRSNGSEVTKSVGNANCQLGGSDCLISQGYGNLKLGAGWEPGTYKVDLFVQGANIATGSFEVTSKATTLNQTGNNPYDSDKILDEIESLMASGKYSGADYKMTFMPTPDGAAAGRRAAHYRRIIDEKLGKVEALKNQETFALEGVVTIKSPEEGTGSFWDFKLQASNGNEYTFSCNSSSQLHFEVDRNYLNIAEGYNKLKNVYENVKLFIPKAQYQYVTNDCKNKNCNGICPSLIVMYETLSEHTLPQTDSLTKKDQNSNALLPSLPKAQSEIEPQKPSAQVISTSVTRPNAATEGDKPRTNPKQIRRINRTPSSVAPPSRDW